jgi:peptide/nickel transport system substrate-binding protein
MDPRLSHPAGNWENYNNPEVVALIDAIPKESDPEILRGIYDQLQEIFLKDLPGIPLFYGAVWYEYSEEYWVGWPNEENGFWFANFWTWPSNMPTLFTIVPKGETPKEPEWVTTMKFKTDEIFAALAKAPTHGYVTVTKTIATTVTDVVTETTTEVMTVTTEVTVPTMDVTSVAGAGVVALIIGVIVGWLVGSKRS